MNRTQRLCRVLRRYASVVFWLCLLGLLFSPGMVFLDSFAIDVANHLLRLLDVDGLRFNASHVGWMLRTFAGVMTAVSLATAVLSLGVLIRLLHQFEGGTAFSLESVRLVRILGWVQVAMVPLDFLLFWHLIVISRSLTTQVVKPWEHSIPSSMEGLFWGGVTLLIAHVLEEGCRLKAEQELVI